MHPLCMLVSPSAHCGLGLISSSMLLQYIPGSASSIDKPGLVIQTHAVQSHQVLMSVISMKCAKAKKVFHMLGFVETYLIIEKLKLRLKHRSVPSTSSTQCTVLQQCRGNGN